MGEIVYYSGPDLVGKSTLLEGISLLSDGITELYSMNRIREKGDFSLCSYIEREQRVIAESTAEILIFDRGLIDLIAYRISHSLLPHGWEKSNLNMKDFTFNVMMEIYNFYYKELVSFVIRNNGNAQFFMFAEDDELVRRIHLREITSMSNFDKRLLNEEGLFSRYQIIYNALHQMLLGINSDSITNTSMSILRFRTDQLN